MDKIKHSIGIILFFCVLVLIVLLICLAPSNKKELGGGYWFDIEGKRIFGPDIDIPPVVEYIKYDDDYIIVKQKPYHLQEEAQYEHTYTYPYGRMATYYWVIDICNHTFQGPIIENEFDSIINSKKIN